MKITIAALLTAILSFAGTWAGLHAAQWWQTRDHYPVHYALAQPAPQEELRPALRESERRQAAKEEQEPETVPENEEPVEAEKRQQLQAILDKFCAEQPGSWDIYVAGLSEETAAARGPGEPMVSASVIKLFVMAAVYEKVEQGILSHDSVYELIYHMITVSDNYSTNRLIELLGAGDSRAGMEIVNGYAAAIGCESSRLNRRMLDWNGLENYTTARDCAKLLTMIYEGTCVTPQWSAEMLQILKEQTVRDRIVQGLPQGTVCANKTGDLSGICCADVGIVFAPKGDYILCILHDDAAPTPKAAMAQLSQAVYALFEA